MASFQFTQDSLENGDFFTIPVTNYTTPQLSAILFPAGESFQEGYRMTLEPGEATMLAAKTPVDANGKPVVITLEYSALDADRMGPQIAVVGLNAPDGHPDGQIGYFYLDKTRNHQSIERLHFVYQPPSGTFLPAVQASLNPNAEQKTSVALYSLSVYPFGAADAHETNFFDFQQKIDPLIVNVNNDAGTVEQDLQAQNMKLTAPGQGAAANFQLTPSGPYDDNTLMVASLDASRQSGADGMTAFVMEHAGQNLGLFVFNRDLPASPESVNLLAGGNFLKYRSPTYLYIQNGGGENETMTSIDNVKIAAYSFESITGFEPAAPTDRLPESLSVAMVLPKTLYGGSHNSFSVTAVDAESRKPVYFPFEVFLTQGEEQITLAKGATNQKGLATQS
ncbi:MAG: hypothetical protein ACP5I1_19810, partial [Candidatus Hinthialibacter sp.]